MGLQVGQVGFKLPLLPLRLLLLPLLRLPPGKKPQPHLGGIKKAFVRHERHSVNGARQDRTGQGRRDSSEYSDTHTTRKTNQCRCHKCQTTALDLPPPSRTVDINVAD